MRAASPFHVNQGQPVGFTGDTLEHLNFFASGAPHGLGGETAPTEELLRALELPATYTAMLASGANYLGAVPAPTGTVAYFETDPVNPTGDPDGQLRRGLRARVGRRPAPGSSTTGTSATASHATGQTVTHTYSGRVWADVKLVVVKGDSTNWGMYRQAVAVEQPDGRAPSTPACGTFSPSRAGAADQGREGRTQAEAPCERNGKTVNAHRGESNDEESRAEVRQAALARPARAHGGRVPAALVASRTASSADGDPGVEPGASGHRRELDLRPQLLRVEQLHLQGRRLGRLPAAGDDCGQAAARSGETEQPAAELQRRAGVLRVVEGRRARATRHSRTATSATR